VVAVHRAYHWQRVIQLSASKAFMEQAARHNTITRAAGGHRPIAV